MGNPIPPEQRLAVARREKGRCLRCGTWSAAQQHHRRSRSVRDEHTHCTCNLVHLCRTCHDWAHMFPFLARRFGWIVSRHEPVPSAITVLSYFGRIALGCDGTYAHKIEEQASE